MKKHAAIALLIVLLTACAPTADIPVNVQNTAMSVAQTGIALTQTALPTPTVIPTATPEATLIPTLPPPPIITPDVVQVERWQEYQTELIKVLLIQYLSTLHDLALCEWDILGRFEQKLYVWALCTLPGGGGANIPTIIHINTDGSVQNVEVPSRGSTWEADINKMFPNEVQEKFDTYTGQSYLDGRLREMSNHIKYRRQHPETPPMVVLSSYSPLPTATPTP